MHLLRMQGAWGSLTGWLYVNVVAAGMDPLYARFIDEALPALPDGAQLLDLGCGDGRFAGHLARRFPGCQVLGLDLSPDMVDRARRGSGLLSNLRFAVDDALNLSQLDGSADLITSLASIKHWPDQLQGLREIRRVLRPGGTLCILEADRNCTVAEARRFVSYWRNVLPGTAWLAAEYFRRYVAGQALDLAELRDLVTRAGFADAELQREDELPFVVARATA